jgi:hypothetical protein
LGFKWYSCDNIPKNLSIGKPIIVNTDFAGNKGVHWITMIRLSEGSYMYDPLGKTNSRVTSGGQLIDHLLIKNKTYVYPFESQMVSSDDCGYFSLYVARLMKKAFRQNPNLTCKQLDQIIQRKFGKTADRGDVKHLSSIKKEVENKESSEDVEPEGAGLKDIWRHFKGVWNAIFVGNRKGFAPRVRLFLEKYGNYYITSLKVCRRPINKVINGLINIAGTSKTSHDTLFHLFFVVQLYNGPVLVVEKLEQVNIAPYVSMKIDDLRNIVIPTSGKFLTLNILFNNAILKVGLHKLCDYDAIERNCQVFIMDMLRSNGLSVPLETQKFIVQNMTNLIPSWLKRLAYFGTSFQNRIDQVVEGQGQRTFQS